MDGGNGKPRPVAVWGVGVSGDARGPLSAGFVEDPERKYRFECHSEEQCQEWIGALRRARWGTGQPGGPRVGPEQGPVSAGCFLPQLRVHAEEPHLLQE